MTALTCRITACLSGFLLFFSSLLFEGSSRQIFDEYLKLNTKTKHVYEARSEKD